MPYVKDGDPIPVAINITAGRVNHYREVAEYLIRAEHDRRKDLKLPPLHPADATQFEGRVLAMCLVGQVEQAMNLRSSTKEEEQGARLNPLDPAVEELKVRQQRAMITQAINERNIEKLRAAMREANK